MAKEETFEDFFVFQQDEFSCGPACISTVARLYQIDSVDYDFFRGILKPIPKVGTSHKKMIKTSRVFLPFESVGEDCYAGDIAIANIFDEEDHYVVFLCREGDKVLYYDPYEHELVSKKISKIEWVSGSNDTKRWAINFTRLPRNSFDRWKKFF